MARPVKWRKVGQIPTVNHFVPSGSDDVVSREENVLKLEELEALRLKDLEGLEQEACAREMEVSRPTFQRILSAAREKVADSLVHGKSILIEGGHATRNLCTVHCAACGSTWAAPFEQVHERSRGSVACPRCGSSTPACQPGEGHTGCPGGRCRFGGHGRRRPGSEGIV